jgi:hypothetical protein
MRSKEDAHDAAIFQPDPLPLVHMADYSRRCLARLQGLAALQIDETLVFFVEFLL